MRKRSQSRHGDYDDGDDERADVNRPPLWFSLLVRHPRDCLIGLAFLAVLATIIINALARSPRESGMGLGVVLLGVPVYFVWTRASAKSSG